MPKLETPQEKIISGIVLVIVSCLVTYVFSVGGKADATELKALSEKVIVLETQFKGMEKTLERIENGQRDIMQYMAMINDKMSSKKGDK